MKKLNPPQVGDPGYVLGFMKYHMADGKSYGEAYSLLLATLVPEGKKQIQRKISKIQTETIYEQYNTHYSPDAIK